MWGSRDPLLEFWHSILSGEWLKLDFKFGIENDDNFGTPIVSRERLKLKTSNLARRRTAVSSKRKCKFRSKGLMWWSRDPLLEFLDPPYTSRMVEARNFKFGD